MKVFKAKPRPLLRMTGICIRSTANQGTAANSEFHLDPEKRYKPRFEDRKLR
jgi:hypothetical protein